MQINYELVEGKVGDRLDNFFKRKNCFVKVNPGSAFMPTKYCEIGEEILKCNVRKDDVWLLSFPRAGSTWAQEMVWLLANNLNYEGAKQLQPLRTPLVELTAILYEDHRDWLTNAIGNSVQMVSSLPSPRFLKSHLPYQLLPEQMDEIKPKIIYVARNPKDLCVSLYHYCVLVHGLVGPFEDFCDIFLGGSAPYGSIWTHMQQMWEKRHEENILFLKYEDMKRDLTSTIYKCAKFLGVEKQITTADVEKLCDHLNFDKMQKNKAVNLENIIQPNTAKGDEKNAVKFIRRGQIGDWKNYMSNEMSLKFDEWIKRNTGESDLTFEYE